MIGVWSGKPREAVLYPGAVAGADPKVGPYCTEVVVGCWRVFGLCNEITYECDR